MKKTSAGGTKWINNGNAGSRRGGFDNNGLPSQKRDAERYYTNGGRAPSVSMSGKGPKYPTKSGKSNAVK